MGYLVFARKYRPQTFEEVVGQDHVCKTLQNALREKRVAHAYIFVGPKGTGKTSVARILAKALNCEHGPAPEPCCTCEICTDITNGSDMDVIEIDGASNRGIDDIKALRENVKFAPGRSRGKVYIIDEVHMLSNAANNALLKTLEEPPSHITFIFATTEPHQVLPTVFSRCQRFDFRMIPLDRIVERLSQICKMENIPVEEEFLYEIARAADGGMRDAQSILDQIVSFGIEGISVKDIRKIIGSLDTESIREVAESILLANTTQALATVNDMLNDGANMKELVGEIITYIRNAVVYKMSNNDANLLPGITHDDRESFKKIINKNTIDRLLLVSKMLEDFLLKSKRMECGRVLLELTLINILRIDNFVSIGELLQNAEGIKEDSPPKGIAEHIDAERPAPDPAREGYSSVAKKRTGIDGNSVTPQDFLKRLNREDRILGASFRKWGIKCNVENNRVVLYLDQGGTFSSDDRYTFESHKEWFALIEKTASGFFKKSIKIDYAFLRSEEKTAPKKEDSGTPPLYGSSEGIIEYQEETVFEKAERIRREEPIVDDIINVFHGRVMDIQEK